MPDDLDFLAGRPTSLGALLEWRVARSGGAEAFRHPDGAGGWTRLTWRQVGDEVTTLAAGLLSLGLAHEQRVSIASSTRIEWVLMDFAINAAGLATTTIYPNTQGPEFVHIVTHSDTKVFVAENAEQHAKLRGFADEVGDQIDYVVLFDGDGDGDRVLSLAQLRERGRAHLAAQPDAVRDAIAACTPDTLATLIYTSGTTGLPKGVELTHGNWLYEGFALERFDIVPVDGVQYLWLPLSHVFGKALLACQLAIGFTSAVDGRLDQIVPGLGANAPTFMCGAPRIFEKVRNAVRTASPSSGLKGRISRWAFAVGRASVPLRLAGRPLTGKLKAQVAIADRLVFSKLRARMGGNIDFFMSGSAKLSPQVQQWFYAAGITVVEGYGMTETSAISTVNHDKRPRFGTVGEPIPGTEVRIADDGEVLIRGGGVMRGYHKDPERTAEVLVDGWLRTGDIGRLTDEGLLVITDRKKDLMKTSGGKYVAPQKVESVMAANIPYVSQTVAVGDGRKYIGALFTLDPVALERWAKNHGKEDLSYAELTQLPEVRASIQRFVDRANKKLERWETVKRFAILPAELTPDDGGVTANMKVRRNAVAEQYADIVDALFESEE